MAAHTGRHARTWCAPYKFSDVRNERPLRQRALVRAMASEHLSVSSRAWSTVFDVAYGQAGLDCYRLQQVALMKQERADVLLWAGVEINHVDTASLAVPHQQSLPKSPRLLAKIRRLIGLPIKLHPRSRHLWILPRRRQQIHKPPQYLFHRFRTRNEPAQAMQATELLKTLAQCFLAIERPGPANRPAGQHVPLPFSHPIRRPFPRAWLVQRERVCSYRRGRIASANTCTAADACKRPASVLSLAGLSIQGIRDSNPD